MRLKVVSSGSLFALNHTFRESVCQRESNLAVAVSHHALSTNRELRANRQLAHSSLGRNEWLDRLAVRAALRLSQRIRRHSRRSERRPISNRCHWREYQTKAALLA